jgi:hypothetical protein
MPFAAKFFQNYLTLKVYSSIIKIWQISFCPNLSVSPCRPWHGDFFVLLILKEHIYMKTSKFFNVVAIIAILVIGAVFSACASEPPPFHEYGSLDGTAIQIAYYSITDQQAKIAVTTIQIFLENLSSIRQDTFKKNITEIHIRHSRSAIMHHLYNNGATLYIPYDISAAGLTAYLDTNKLLD